MGTPLDDAALDTIFRNARSHNKWLKKAVVQVKLHELYEIMRFGPTSANCCPARIVFAQSREAKEKLKSVAAAGNHKKILTAPVVAIIGFDTKFYDFMPQLMPVKPEYREIFASREEPGDTTAFRNSTLQGAYFIIAARAIGLDCGPMSGFDNEKCDKLFFPDGRIKSNFLCAIGYGDSDGIFPRLPRLSFDEACSTC